MPVIENLAASAISTTSFAPAIISRLIGTSIMVVSHTPISRSTPLVPRNRMSDLIWRSESSASTPTIER